ncbi:hypothetical protein QVD17_36219 [Tagetes erecta]|uniref:Uncharacterized protein n=1 Tax=Tagetes erecta TaxID=13708 RepID=A0AAD8JY54_TARER|nr:hypothetical protein QVD17_36219 [Tagetes erecta]
MKVDYQVMPDPLCPAMLNGLGMLSNVLMKQERSCRLCLGANTTALADFLANELKFRVVWAEEDSELYAIMVTEFKLQNCRLLNVSWKHIIKEGDNADMELTSPHKENIKQDDTLMVLTASKQKKLAKFHRDYGKFKFDVIMIQPSE